MTDEQQATREVMYLEPITDPLIAFYWARLDEAAAPLARTAWHREWCRDGDAGVENGKCLYCGEVEDLSKVELVPRPACVLADVAAKKAILDDYARYCADVENPARQVICQVTRDVIKRLAAVYSSHPEYREEFKP